MTREEQLANHKKEVFARKNGIGRVHAKTVKDVILTQVVMNGAHEFPYNHVQEYKGFELWKSEEGVKGDFCIRYTGFGKPIMNSKANQTMMGKSILRMPFFRVNVTSAKFLKEFITTCINDN